MVSIDDNVSCELVFSRRGNQVLHLKGDLSGGPHQLGNNLFPKVIRLHLNAEELKLSHFIFF